MPVHPRRMLMDGFQERISRRAALRWGFVSASTVAVGVTATGAATASPAEPAAGEGGLARVLGVAGGIVSVELLTSAGRTRGTMAVPFAGFPDAITPRRGDLVAIGKNVSGYAVAAAPLCSWFTGVPRATMAGGLEVAGKTVVASPALSEAVRRGVSARVCLLDTELPAALVLSVR